MAKVGAENYSINHLISDTAAYRAFEPQRTSNAYFEIELDGIELVDLYGDPLAPIPPSAVSNYGLNTLLRVSLESMGMPNNSSEVLSIRKGNEVVKYAGGVTFENIELTVTDWIGADMERLISAWDGMRYNPFTGILNPSYKYKRTGTIVQYSPDGEITRTWTCLGCWINNVRYGEYNRTNAATERKITFTVHVDKAYPDRRQEGTNY